MSKNNDTYYKSQALHYTNEATIMMGCNAAVVVEDKDDEVFWNKIFTHFLPKYSFYFISNSQTPKGKKATGSSNCLRYYKLGCLSKEFFICIDSDYRYLLREQEIDIKHFIFQTYTYSFENHYCYFKNIENIFAKYGLCNDLFNVKDFIDAFSKSLYRPFMYHLLSIKKADGLFSDNEFNSLISTVNIQNLNRSQIISEMKKYIDDKIKPLNKKYNKSEIQAIENEYSNLGLTSKNAYLYYRGHNLFPLIIKLTKKIHKELELKKITNYTVDERKAYFSQPQKFIKDCLTEDVYFDKYSEIDKIKADTIVYKKL